MKRLLPLLLAALLVLSMAGCQKTPKTLSCQQVIDAYEAAGYTVSHREYPEQEYGYACHVVIEDGEDRISFEFYDSVQEAEAAAQERQWNVLLYGFSIIFGEPTWLRTETYGSIEIEYTEPALYRIFQQLTR